MQRVNCNMDQANFTCDFVATSGPSPTRKAWRGSFKVTDWPELDGRPSFEENGSWVVVSMASSAARFRSASSSIGSSSHRSTRKCSPDLGQLHPKEAPP